MQTLQNPNFNFKKTETNIKQINIQAPKENNRQLVSYRWSFNICKNAFKLKNRMKFYSEKGNRNKCLKIKFK